MWNAFKFSLSYDSDRIRIGKLKESLPGRGRLRVTGGIGGVRVAWGRWLSAGPGTRTSWPGPPACGHGHCDDHHDHHDRRDRLRVRGRVPDPPRLKRQSWWPVAAPLGQARAGCRLTVPQPGPARAPGPSRRSSRLDQAPSRRTPWHLHS